MFSSWLIDAPSISGSSLQECSFIINNGIFYLVISLESFGHSKVFPLELQPLNPDSGKNLLTTDASDILGFSTCHSTCIVCL